MSSQRTGSNDGANSANWRQGPPHLASQPAGDPGPVDATFHTAQSFEDTEGPDRPASVHSSDHLESESRLSTRSPETGLLLTLRTDSTGRRFFHEASTGLNFGLAADIEAMSTEAIQALLPTSPLPSSKTSSTPSDASDVTPESDSGSIGTTRIDEGLSALLSELNPAALTLPQRALLNRVRGAISTGRSRLLSSTALTVDHHGITTTMHDSLVRLRNDTATKITDLHTKIDSERVTLEAHISANAAALREMGASEAAIASVIGKMSPQPLDAPTLPTVEPTPPLELPTALRAELDNTLSPRQPEETAAEFQRRARLAHDSHKRAAAAFAMGPTESSTARPQQFAEANSRMNPNHKSLRFEDMSRKPPRWMDWDSDQMHPGWSPLATRVSTAEGILEEYHLENDKKIADIIRRQVGEAIVVPPHVRSPKMSSPDNFTGDENDPVLFIKYLEKLVTWMRASLYGGPELDEFRITILKTYLTGNALEWFLEYVEPTGHPSTVPHNFTSIVCAMHRRFVTLATAQKASRDFDAVRYKSDEGPMKLMDNLITASRRLREPMPDFMIRKTFMKLIPDAMSDMMILHRGLNAEYSTIKQLRFHAHHIWDANNNQLSHRNRPPVHPSIRASPSLPPRSDPTTRRPSSRPAPVTSSPRANPLPASTRGPIGTVNSAASNANKRCFKCGIVGHIASEKICPQHPEHNDRPRVGLAAQRVPDTYAEDDYAILEEGTHEALIDDNWGGSQFGHEGIDDGPGPTPEDGDLGDLIDFDQTVEARAGAMRFQYYSIRIEPDDIDEPETANPTLPLPSEIPHAVAVNTSEPASLESVREIQGVTLTELERELAEIPYFDRDERTVDDLWGPSAEVDVDRLNEVRTDRGLPEFTPDEASAKRRQLVLAHEYPISRWTSFDELAFEHQVHQGDHPVSRSATEEWDILLEYDASIHARTTLHSIWIPRPIAVSVSTAILSGRTNFLEAEVDRCDEAVNEINTSLGELEEVRAQARAELAAAEYRRNPIRRRARQVLGRIREIYRGMIEEIRDRRQDLEVRVTHLRALQEVMLDEIDRRTVPVHEPGTARVTEEDSEDEQRPSPVSPPPGYNTPSDDTFRASASPPVVIETPSLHPEEASNYTAPAGEPNETARDPPATDEEPAPEYAPPPDSADPSPDQYAPPTDLAGPSHDRELWGEVPEIEGYLLDHPALGGDDPGPNAQEQERILFSRRIVPEDEESALADSHSWTPGVLPPFRFRVDPMRAATRAAALPALDEEPRREFHFYSDGITRASRPASLPQPSFSEAVRRLREQPSYSPSPVTMPVSMLAGPSTLTAPPVAADDFRWEEIPGILNTPEDPEEEIDGGRVWIHGIDYDFTNGYAANDDWWSPSVSPITSEEEVTDLLMSDPGPPSDQPGPEEQGADPRSNIDPGLDAAHVLIDARRERAEPGEDDELVIRSVVTIMGTNSAEYWLTYRDHQGRLYVRVRPLPPTHYLSPELASAHREAMEEAINQRAEELDCSPDQTATIFVTGEDIVTPPLTFSPEMLSMRACRRPAPKKMILKRSLDSVPNTSLNELNTWPACDDLPTPYRA
ncbi:hypothetical protein B0H11DRAFT_1923289 [Mycena galericulata]|nr:hypothetical protein B0H11DRAFT_1923289 [Mycena galericulata]